MVRLHKNQAGLASMVIAIIISLILTTLVIGFARIIRREQRRSLDNQLSTQAFYAAETGVNDARKVLAGNPTKTKTTCANDTDFTAAMASIDAAHNVSYSCLLIDPADDSLDYDGVGTQPVVFPIQPDSAGKINRFTFSWTDHAGATGVYTSPTPGATDFPDVSTWGNKIGVVRVELTPLPTGATIYRDTLIASTRTVFLYPTTSLGSTPTYTFSGAVNGDIVKAYCTSGTCSVTIDTAALSVDRMYARVSSIYRDIDLNPNNLIDSTNTKVGFKGAQVLVDSTGKAQDVLRRIQVRVPVTPDVTLPEQVLNSVNTICKRMVVQPNGVTSDDPDSNCDPNPN